MRFFPKQFLLGLLAMTSIGLLVGCSKTDTPTPAATAPIVAKWTLADIKGVFSTNYSGSASSAIDQKGTGSETFTFAADNSFVSVGSFKISSVSINAGTGTYKITGDELRIQAKDDLSKDNVYYFKATIVGSSMTLQLTRDLYFKGLKESAGYAAGVQEAIIKDLDVTLSFKK